MLSHWKSGAGPPASVSPQALWLSSPTQWPNSAPMGVPKKESISQSVLVSSLDFTEKFGVYTNSTVDNLNPHQYFWSLLSLLSATTGFPSHQSSRQPLPTGAHSVASHPCLQVTTLLIPQDHSPLQEAMPYKLIKEWDVLILQLVVYFSLHLFPGV